jgi:uncharacterized protein (TIGR03067 family)
LTDALSGLRFPVIPCNFPGRPGPAEFGEKPPDFSGCLNLSGLQRNLLHGVENRNAFVWLGREIVKTHLFLALAAGLLIASHDGKDRVTEETKKLEGTWTIAAVVRNENPLPEEKTRDGRFVFKGEAFVQKIGDGTLAKGTFRPDPSKNPPTIDLMMNEGEEKGETIKAIYELNDDVLRICGAAPGHERPTEFSARDASGHTLVTLKRAKP